jgi:hypothetical protein
MIIFVFIKSPKQRLETYCFCSLSYYYYITPTAVGLCIVILRFFFTILILIIILPHIFVSSISRRCLDQTLWNLVGILYAMWSCAVKGAVRSDRFWNTQCFLPKKFLSYVTGCQNNQMLDCTSFTVSHTTDQL